MKLRTGFLRTLALILPLSAVQPALAIHVYGYYDCANETLRLAYDGPGTNYAVGGYSHFYSSDKSVKALSFQNLEQESEQIGSTIGEDGEAVEVLFTDISDVAVGDKTSDVKPGDACEPEEYSYVTTDWTSERRIKIEDVAQSATAKFGLLKGSEVKFTCSNSMSVPFKCPASGRVTKEDLE